MSSDIITVEEAIQTGLAVDNRLPGPSSLGRIWRCEASEGLRHFEYAPHEYTDLGDAMHGFLRIAYETDRDSALAWARENHRHLLEAFELTPFERLPPPGNGTYTAEVSIAYNVRTGKARIIGQNLNRNEARALALPGEMVGTVDLAAMEGSDSVFALDWKTGWKPVPPAELNWQIKTYVLMLARAMGAKRGRCAIVRVLFNGNVPPWDWAELDEEDLLVHEAELRQLMKRRDKIIADAKAGLPLPPVVVGEHCDYCPARLSCPAHIQYLRAASGLEEHEALTWGTLGAGYRRNQQNRKTSNIIEGWYRAMAKGNPIDIGNGEFLGVKLKRTQVINPERAEETLATLWGAGTAKTVANACITIVAKFTRKALRKGIKDLVLPQKEGAFISHLEKEALDALRHNFALTLKESKPVRVFRPGKASEDEETFDEEEDEAA